MTPLTRNRLIGGAIVALAAMLFIPAILTPEKKDLRNPELTINIDAEKPLVGRNISDESSQKNDEIAISLTSIDKKTVLLAPPRPDDVKEDKQATTIQLESVDSSTEEDKKVVNKPISQSAVIASDGNEVNWVRVGSFADFQNAENLSSNLKGQGFNSSVKTITVSGKNYHRVLIGPFDDEEEMRRIINKLTDEGFTPSIQH